MVMYLKALLNVASGHVRKRGSTWSYVHWFVDPASGKRRQSWRGGFSSQQKANKALRDALCAIDDGTFVEPSKLRLAGYVDDIWLPMLKSQVESSTWESYERNMRVHVIPKLGGLRLQSLGPNHLNELYKDLGAQRVGPSVVERSRPRPQAIYELIANLRASNYTHQAIAEELTRRAPQQGFISRHAVAGILRRMDKDPLRSQPLSIKTVRYIHSIISRALNDAVRQGLVARNVASMATPPRMAKTKTQKQLWSGDQTRDFLVWVRQIEHRLWPAWAFVATSGDRRGGNIGVRWGDIDLDSGIARMIWTVTCVRHRLVIKPYGKSGKPHEILLDDATIAMLRWWKAFVDLERSIYLTSHRCISVEADCEMEGYHDRDLVFCRPDGNYLHPERFTREFQRAQVRYN